MKKTLGQMLSEAMVAGNVSRTDLCRGLCSTSAFSRYLNGERRIDRLLLTALMQGVVQERLLRDSMPQLFEGSVQRGKNKPE